MDKTELLDILNLLSENEITCLIYNRVLGFTLEETAKCRNYSHSKAKYLSQQVNKALNHEELIAALQELFFNSDDFPQN
jgi:hypothetical protein